MKRKPVLYAAAAALFAMVLLYATIVSMPDRPPTGVDHTAAAAAAECEEAVGEEVQGAQFPFSATASYLGDRAYRLNGTVEAEAGGEKVRRNYECFVRYTAAGRYHTDSLTVWQSH